jgi:hypothetical protein
MKVVTLTTPVEARLRAVPPATLAMMEGVPGIRYADNTVSFAAPDFQAAYDGLIALIGVATAGYTSVLRETIRAHPAGAEIQDRNRNSLFERWMDVESGRYTPPARAAAPAARRYHGAN